MKRLHRLVIKSFLGPFVMTFFIVLFLLLIQFLWRYIDELVGKGLGISIIAEFLMYASAGLVPLALPLAVLLSSLMTFGNLGEYYELTAIKASGIALQRIMFPVVILVIFISIGAFFFSNNVVPVTNLKMRSLRSDVNRLSHEINITEGVFFKGIENYSIRINKEDPVKKMLYDIKIYDHSGSRGNLDVTVADSGRMKMTEDKRNMIITLWSGCKYTEIDEGRRKKDKSRPHRQLKFKEQNIIIPMTGYEFSRTDENAFKNSYQMLDVQQLKHTGDSLKRALIRRSRDFKDKIITNSFFKINKSDFRSIVDENRYFIPRPRPLAIKPDPKTEARRLSLQQRPDLKKLNPKITDTITDVDTIQKVKKIELKKIDQYDSLYYSLSLESRGRILMNAINNVSSNQAMLYGSTANMAYDTRLLRRHEIEWHRKFTLAFACLIFLFIGAPLGAIVRKGGLGLPTVISTLLFILYYIISLTGQKFVEESILSAFEGMWLSSFLLVITGIFLTYQATNDSAILNLDTYVNWIREQAGLRKGILLEKKLNVAGKFELNEIPRERLQENFIEIGKLAKTNLELLKNDGRWLSLFKKSFANTGFFYLVEFGIHYNGFIDEVLTSKWFRIPYFQKRLTEFPLIDGKITSTIFTNKIWRLIALILFPLAIIRLIHLRFKIHLLRRNLRQVADLSSGMVNLLNSSALKIESVTA